MAQALLNNPKCKLGTIADILNAADPSILAEWDGWHYSTVCTSQIDSEDAYVRLTLAWKPEEGKKAMFCDGLQISKLKSYYIPLVNTTGKAIVYTSDQYDALYEDYTGTGKEQHGRY